MFYLNPDVKQLVDATGKVTADKQSEVETCIQAAGAMIQRMLGCTVVIRGKKFIFSNLELYYGGIGDEAHDWHRANFQGTRGISKENSKAQLEPGVRFYLKQLSEGKSRQNRMDIVVGDKGVAISFLIRNVLDENLNSVSDSEDGNPALLLWADKMNILKTDHGICLNEHPDFDFIDTHHEFVKSLDQITRDKRFSTQKETTPEGKVKTKRGYIGFNHGPFGQHEWNFKLKL